MAFHADAIDHRVGADAAGHLVERLADVALGVIEDFRAKVAGKLQPRREMVDGDDPLGTEQQRRLDREQPDRAAAPHGDRVAGLDVGIDRGLPAGRQDVGQEQDLVVLEAVGNDHRADVGIGHADIFGLAAGIAAGEVGIAERAAHRVAHQDFGGVGGLRRVAVVAGAELLALAEEALAARDGEGDDHALALLERRLGADLDHLAHEFVADDVARAHGRDIAVVEVEVGAADRGRGDLEDRVARIDDLGIGDGVDADVVAALPGYGAHKGFLRFEVGRGIRTCGRTVRR